MPSPQEHEAALFQAAVQLTGAARAAFLKETCLGDDALRERLEVRLAAHEQTETLQATQVERARPDAPDEATRKSMAGKVIAGRYTLSERLGEGGMGEVWVAAQTEPIKRQVALKLIKTGMDSKAVVQRFDQERQALAVMDHPNIARVIDGGLTPTGQPFFVMELVNGLPLTKFCDEAKLTPKERLALFVPICQAVQHAHQKGIVHRDLKPANILVTRVDGKPVPKVIDFGVAKATAGKLTAESMATQFGAVIGTLEYMSPEQAGGEDVDTRADVYALGVILYELLTGLRPIDTERLQKAALVEMIRIVQEDEPLKPSTRLSTEGSLPSLAALRQTEPRKLMTMLRGELDWVVMRCLEKQRDRRYETADGLVRDIHRYLADEPVDARPPSAGYRFQKFVRRNKRSVVAAGLVLLSSVLGTAVASRQAAIASRQRDLAVEAQKVADEQRNRAVHAEDQANKRANELQKVADYQAKMLQQVDVKEAGVRLMRDLRVRHDAALERIKVPEGEKSARRAAIERELHLVNATDAAAALLDLTLLSPAVRTIDTQFADQALVDASLRTTLGVVYQALGRSEEALTLYQRAYALRAASLGEDHPDTLASRCGVGQALGELQRLAEAETTVRAALNAYQRVLGEDRKETLATKSLLATQLNYQGKYEECEAITRDVLERRMRVQGPDDPATLETMNELGRFLMNRGKYADAVKVLREVVEAQRRIADSSVAATLGNLGLALNRQRDYAAAEPCLREALQRRRRDQGEDHPDTMTSASNLAVLLMDRDNLSEAESLAREALEKSRRIHGNEHADTLKAMNVMGQVLYRQNKFTETEPYYREALATGRRVLGEEHPDTIIWISNLGFVLQRLGRLAEAEPYYLEALEKNHRQLGETHPYTITMTRNLCELLRQENKPAEAEVYLRTALANVRRVEGEDHPETLSLSGLLGSVLRDQGKLDEAEKFFEQLLEKSRHLNGEDHANTLVAILRMASLRVAQGKYSEALALLTPIEPKVQKTFPGVPGLLRAASLQGLLGKARMGLARQPADYAHAEGNLLEAHAVFAKNRGEKDKETREWAQALVDFYLAWDKVEPGKGYATRSAEWKAKL